MSGDANTAAGNCIIVAVMLTAFGRHLGQQYDFLCDGDDSVFFHRGSLLPEEEIVSFFRRFGMSIKIEGRPTSFEQINFCQSKPCLIGGEWTMVRDPVKILSKSLLSHKIGHPKGRAKYLKTLALGELSLNRGVPLLQSFLKRVVDVCDIKMSKRSLKRGKLALGAIEDSYRLSQLVPTDWQDARVEPITNQVRESFHRAWGVDESLQKCWERRLEQWEFDLGKTQDVEGLSYPWIPYWRRPEVQ